MWGACDSGVNKQFRHRLQHLILTSWNYVPCLSKSTLHNFDMDDDDMKVDQVKKQDKRAAIRKRFRYEFGGP